MPEPVICPECKRTVGNNAGLSMHMKSMHREVWRRQQEAAATPSRGARPVAIPSVPPPSGSNGIVWEEPPSRGRSASLVPEFASLAVELRRHADRWARFRVWPSKSGASTAVKTLRAAYPDIEFRPGRHDDGSAVWARFPEEA